MMQRVLAVISAALLVTAVAVATFGPQSVTLGEALYLLDHDFVGKLLALSHRFWGDWAREALIQPLLLRPAWLIPASAGIICAGVSLSLSGRKSTRRSHRRS
jgi:uncharacterized membrane protein